MKFEELDRRTRNRGGWDRAVDRRDERAEAKRSFTSTERFPSLEAVMRHGVSDEEIESMFDKNAPYYESGIVEVSRHNDFHKKTVQIFAWPCIRNGWSVVPQQRGFKDRPGDLAGGNDERKPAATPYSTANGKWLTQPFLPTKWRTVRPTIRQCLEFRWYSGENLAIQCCEASMHARGLDADCKDADVAAVVRAAAFKHLGVTPFSRVGSAPREMLIYRVEGEDINIAKFSITFLNADGTPDVDEDGKPRNVVEFIANGGIITYYGLHHRTGQSFDHSGGALHPAIAGPEHAPVITRQMLRDFEEELALFRPIKGTTPTSNPYGSSASTVEFDRAAYGRLWTPKVSSGEFQLDADGYVVKGAEEWLTSQAWALCGANAHDFEALLPAMEDWLIKHAQEKLLRYKRNKSGYATAANIAATVKVKLRPAVAKWRQSLESKARGGNYLHKAVPYRILADGRRPTAQRITPSARPADGSLDWIPSETSSIEALASYKTRTPVSMVKKTVEQLDIDKKCRQLIEDLDERHRVTTAISDQVGDGVESFLREAEAWHLRAAVLVQKSDEIENGKEEDIPAPLAILRGPTGAGKTTRVIDKLAAYCQRNPRKAGEGPVLLVVPTHANGEEAVSKALASGAYNGDVWSIADMQAAVDRGEDLGVGIMRFVGREEAGCQMMEQMKTLSQVGIRGSGLCEAYVDTVSELEATMLRRRGDKVPREKVLCEYRERGECEYYKQHDKLRTADVVIVTHAFLTQHGLPKELKNPRLVVADESTTYQLLHQTRIPVSVLDLGRARPRPTKLDRTRYPGVTSEEVSLRIYGGRLRACEIAREALASGKDVAQHFFALHGADSLELVDDAIVVCERSHEADRLVLPNQSLSKVKEIAKTASAEHLMEEIRFWRIVRDRLQMLVDNGADGKPTAKGRRDMRLQVVQMPHYRTGLVEPHIRMSWRKTPNWTAAPMLLLDASANPRIVAKCFGKTPRVIDIEAPLHVRTVVMIEKTWSTATFIPGDDATSYQLRTAAENIKEARELITITALQYGHGRVLVGSTLTVRQVIAGDAWTSPPNVDFVHFGALRGLDFAKFHVAAISIGRSEQPIHIIDGYVAALTYDDEKPELPFDILGTGLTEAGKPLFRPHVERVITMRNGQDWSHWVPEMPGTGTVDADGKPIRSWAQDLEEAWREEELRQFVGRLRPVYRGLLLDDAGVPMDVEPPVWIAVGKVQPGGMIVDEVVEMRQLLKPAAIFDLIRLAEGVMDWAVLGRSDAVMEAQKALPKSPSYIKRTASVMWQVKYAVGANISIAGVSPVWLDGRDAGELFAEKAAVVGVEVKVLQVTSPTRKVAGVRVKKADKIDLAAAPLVSRRNVEAILRAAGEYEGIVAALVEQKLLKGERVAGIALHDVEPVYDDIEEMLEARYVHHLSKDSFEDYWGGHGWTIGGVPIDSLWALSDAVRPALAEGSCGAGSGPPGLRNESAEADIISPARHVNPKHLGSRIRGDGSVRYGQP